MQPPCSGDMHDALLSPNATHHQIHHQNAEFDPTSTQDDDFFDQMLSSPIPSSPRPGVLDLNPNNTCSYDDSMILASMISGGGDGSVQALLKGFAGALHTSSQPQHFHQSRGGTMPMQSFGGPGPGPVMKQGQTSGGGGSTASQAKQKVRARRGQATDPHSIAERLRRERIAERMKALQELVPNANKTDKASMLDEIIDYVKFLQLQVKVLSMSRLGGGGAAPLLAGISSQDGGGQANRRSPNGTQANDDSLTVTEHQVAKLMEEDMGSAMQYLQGKGLCLMPISLATAISTATATNNNPPLLQQLHSNNGEGPTSPAMSSGLTVQSATLANGGNDCSAKDAASVSKP